MAHRQNGAPTIGGGAQRRGAAARTLGVHGTEQPAAGGDAADDEAALAAAHEDGAAGVAVARVLVRLAGAAGDEDVDAGRQQAADARDLDEALALRPGAELRRAAVGHALFAATDGRQSRQRSQPKPTVAALT